MTGYFDMDDVDDIFSKIDGCTLNSCNTKLLHNKFLNTKWLRFQ